MQIFHEGAVVGGKFIKKSTESTKVHFGSYINYFDIRVVVETMVRDKEGSVSNFTERVVLKCLYCISIRFFC